MRETRFKHLVNLYLDGELSATEETELARELARNPDHKSRFIEYRKLHGATQRFLCKVSPSACGVTEAVRRSRRSLLLSLYPVALASVAAGVAVVLLTYPGSRLRRLGATPPDLQSREIDGGASVHKAKSQPVNIEVIASVSMPKRQPEAESGSATEATPNLNSTQALFATYVPYYMAEQHNQAHLRALPNTSRVEYTPRITLGNAHGGNGTQLLGNTAADLWKQWSSTEQYSISPASYSDFKVSMASY
ncbi:MAG: hypothetical protein SFY80_06520 [Verrucomicrobiota bacterium]|nr:hypothetical protein [Verrucomicrobiota bacterium]